MTLGDQSTFRVARATRISVLLLFLAWIVDYIDRLVITLALPDIGHQFGLSKAEEGLVLTAFFLTYALAQLPGGFLADRFGAKATMVAALVAWSVFTGLTGLAWTFAVLLVIRALFGVTEGIFPGASMKATSERTLPEERMTANGLILASNPLGAALAPLVAAPLMIAVGWQAAFFVVAGAGFVMAAALWTWLPRPIIAQPEKRRPDNSNPAREDGGVGGPTPAVFSTRQLVRSWTMWHFALVFCGFDIVSWGLVSWAPSFLLEERGVPLAKTGVLAAIPWFVAAAATVLGGWMFDRWLNDRPRRVIVPSMLVTAVFLWFMTQSQTAGEFVLFETLGMAAMWVSFMPIFGLPLRLLPASTAGIGGSLVNFGGQFAGAIAPFVMGWLADRFSFSAAFGFLIFGCLLAVAAAATMPQDPETFQRRLALNTRDDAKAA